MKNKMDEDLQLLAVLGCIVLYFLYGAITGTTYIPLRNATAAVQGFLAWWLFASSSSLFLYLILLFRGTRRVRVRLAKCKIDTLIFFAVLVVLPIIATGFQASKNGA